MAKHVHDLTALIAEFPGIGPRQARRVVQFLLHKDGAYRTRLSELIQNIRNHVSQCSVCFRFDDLNGNTVCKICSDANRDATQLMVVEKDVDIEGVEASGAYKGRYFVLGGLMRLSERKNDVQIRSKELLARIQKTPPSVEGGVQEVIFALASTPEGDFTSREIIRNISSSLPEVTSRLSILGRGLSVGAEIEYADAETLRNALQNRT